MKTKKLHLFLFVVLLGVSFTLGAQTWATKPVANFSNVASEHDYANGWDANIYTKWKANPNNSFTVANNFTTGTSYLQFRWNTIGSLTPAYILISNASFGFPYSLESKIGHSGWNSGIVLRANPSNIDFLQDGLGSETKFNREGISISPAKDDVTKFRIQFTNAAKTANSQFNIPNPSGVTTSLGIIDYKIEDYDSQIYVYINNQPFAIIALAGLTNNIYTSATVYDAAGAQVGTTTTDVKVDRISKVAFAQRTGDMKLYSYKIKTDITSNGAFDTRPATTFTTQYEQDFTTGPWDGTTFNAKWNTIDANTFVAGDIALGYLKFSWSGKRVLSAKTTQAYPYKFESTFTSAGNAGVAIRVNPTTPDNIQTPAATSAFNREGIIFYPASNLTTLGTIMRIQFSKGSGSVNTAYSIYYIDVPKPAGLASTTANLKLTIEDYDDVIYAFINDLPFVRINLSNLVDGIYTAGTIYDANMAKLGEFSNMEVERANVVLGYGMRVADLFLYKSKISSGSVATYTTTAAGNWSSTSTWAGGIVPGSNENVVIDHNITLDANATVSGLTINSGATVEVNAAKQLTVKNALINNGTLTLKSADGVGTGTIITTGTVSGSGTTTVEQFVSSAAMGTTGRNWYVSSPLTAATSSTITNETGNGLVYWNGTAWTAAGTTMDVMKGYIAKSPAGPKTIQFTGGALNTGNQLVSNLPVGFNLVGNPYASYVDFAQATKINVTNSIWYRSKRTGSYVFQTYNVSSNIGANDGTAIIPPMQSFWIKTENATNALQFSTLLQSHQDQSVATNRLKAPAISTQKLLRLEVASGSDKDETVVYFNDGALNTFDAYDSQKMFNEIAGAPEVYTFSDNKNLIINGFNSIQMDAEIPVGFRTGNTDANVNFKFKATQLQNFGTETELVLIDKGVTTTTTVLNEGSEYTFKSAAVNTTDRFSLVFRTKGSTTGGSSFGTFENKIRIQKNENNQLVVNCDNAVLKNASLTVYNAAGQKLMQQNIHSSSTILAPAFKAGVYMVQLNSEGKSYRVKVIM